VRSKIKEEMDLRKKYERFSQRDTDIGSHFRVFNNCYQQPGSTGYGVSHVAGYEEIWHDDDRHLELRVGIPCHP